LLTKYSAAFESVPFNMETTHIKFRGDYFDLNELCAISFPAGRHRLSSAATEILRAIMALFMFQQLDHGFNHVPSDL